MEIGRDVTGQVIAGDHNIVISAAHGSSVTLLKPGDLPRPVRRDRIRLLPRRGLAPIGRDTELGRLLDAARPGAQVQVYGPPGVGKTTLIRQLAIRLPGDVVFLSCGGRDADDLRQDIFESCFESAGYRPSTVEMRRLMTGLEVTLVIDDLTVSDELLDAVPDACVIWTATDRQQDDVHALELRGLDQAAGIGMIERHLGRSLSRAETDSAAMIWKLTAGLPLPILQAMSAANAGGALPATRDDVVRTLIPMLDPSAREALALMLAVAPAAVTPELLSVTLPGSGADQLVRFGLVTLDEDGYRAAALDAAPLSVSRERVASVSSNILAWLAAAPTTAQQVSANGPAISRVIDLAMAAGDPSLACELARAAAPALGASLRWGSWQMILARGTAAATKIRNSAALAYFTHENGIRSLGLGKRVAAGAALGGAIALWQQLGESSSLSAAQTAQGLAAPPGGPVAGPAWTPPPTTPSVPTSPGPAPTPAPGPGASPGPTGTPGPATPGPTPSPGPTPTPGSPPGPGAAPGPTGTPGPATPGPTPTPTPSPPPGPTPVPPLAAKGWYSPLSPRAACP